MRTTAAILAVAFTLRLSADPRIRTLEVDRLRSTINRMAEQLGEERKRYERSVAILRHLRTADKALIDAMQPTVAVQKALDEVMKAEGLSPNSNSLVAMRQELERARLSPTTADFDRLRRLLRENTIDPFARGVLGTAASLQRELTAWLALQNDIANHMDALNQTIGAGLTEGLRE
jgi:hypothetical protein